MSSPAFPLESFYSWRSLRQSWARLVARLLYPACREEVLAELHRRSRLGGRVVSRCRCGGLEVECEAPPGLVTVCHCSVCRSPSPFPPSPVIISSSSDMTRPPHWDWRTPRLPASVRCPGPAVGWWGWGWATRRGISSPSETHQTSHGGVAVRYPSQHRPGLVPHTILYVYSCAPQPW